MGLNGLGHEELATNIKVIHEAEIRECDITKMLDELDASIID